MIITITVMLFFLNEINAKRRVTIQLISFEMSIVVYFPRKVARIVSRLVSSDTPLFLSYHRAVPVQPF